MTRVQLHARCNDPKRSTSDQNEASRSTLIQNDSTACASLHSPGRDDQAAEFVAWLQAPGGRTGWIASRDLQEIYLDACCERGWHPLPWRCIAQAIRRALGGQPRRYGYSRGVRACGFDIPRPALRLVV